MRRWTKQAWSIREIAPSSYWASVRPSLLTALLAGVLTLALVALPALAGAHSELLGSSPAPGERHAPALQTVELQFDETVTFPDISLITPDGREISGLLSSPREGNIRVTLPEPEMVLGTWTVVWEVRSPDGDSTNGGFTFGLSEDGIPIEALPESLVSTGGRDREDVPESRSPIFFIALGVTIALGALMVWAGFDALSRRIRADNNTKENEAEPNQPEAEHEAEN